MDDANPLDLAPLDLDPIEIPTEPLEPASQAVEAALLTVSTPGFWESADLWATPILASSIVAALLGTVGVYIVLARAAFVSAAVSQLAGLGVVVVLLFFGGLLDHVEPAARLGGLAFGVLGTALFAMPVSTTRTPNDALLAMAVIAASALTLVGAATLTSEYQHVQNALYGDAVVAARWEVWLMAGVAVALLAPERRLRYRLLFALVDPDSATAQRVRVTRWRLALGVAISLAIGLATVVVGALPAFAFSILPAATALRFGLPLAGVFVLAPVLGLVAAGLGYYLAFVWALPVGPTMVAVLLVPLAASAFRRGD